MSRFPETLSGPQGSGRSRALALRIERHVRSSDRPVVVVDPAGTWRGRELPEGVILLDASVTGSATLAALTVLVRRAPGGMVAIDDCELISAPSHEWRAFHAAARATSTSLVLVVPEAAASGIADGGRTPSALFAFGALRPARG